MTNRLKRWMLGAWVGALFLSSGWSLPANAEQECIVAPFLRRVTHSLYVQEFGLQCPERSIEAVDQLKRTRDELSLYRELCREMGDDPKSCGELLLEGTTPQTRSILNAIEFVRLRAETQRAKVPEPPMNPHPVVWRTPKLLTNESE